MKQLAVTPPPRSSANTNALHRIELGYSPPADLLIQLSFPVPNIVSPSRHLSAPSGAEGPLAASERGGGG